MKRINLVLFLFFFCSNLYSQQPILSFPFVDGRSLIVDMECSGKHLKLVFDTGSMSNILDSTLVGILGGRVLEPSHEIQFALTKRMSAMARIPALADFDESWIAVKNFKDDTHADGIIGGGILFKKYVIEFDFENHKINAYSVETYLPSNSNYIQIAIVRAKLTSGTSNGNSGFLLSKSAIVKQKNFRSTDSSLYNHSVFLQKKAFSKSFENQSGWSAVGSRPLISCCIQLKDTMLKDIPLLIDSGYTGDLAIMVSDSSLVKRLSDRYGFCESSFVRESHYLGYANASYQLANSLLNGSCEAPIFIDPGFIASSGSRSVGGLLGLSFFRRFKKVVIDVSNSVLYLEQ